MRACRRQSGGFDRRNLAFEDREALRVFVAQINVDVGGLDRPGGDQHPFQKSMRIGFEEIAVLEGAGLALVAIDRQQPRCRLLAYQPPFAAGRKTGAAEPAQTRMLEGFDHLIAGALARQASLQQVIAALHAVVVKADKFRDRRMRLTGGNRGGDRGGGRMLVQRVADGDDRGLVAAAHARARARPARQRRAGSGDRSAGSRRRRARS